MSVIYYVTLAFIYSGLAFVMTFNCLMIKVLWIKLVGEKEEEVWL